LPEPSTTPLLAREEGRALLAVARASIAHGIACGRPLPVDPSAHAPALRAPGAAFVTLRRNGALRGCVGELRASRPLVASVAEQAWAAAFRDPRFAPLARDELDALDLHVAVLGAPEPIDARSQAELLAALRPGVDGVIVEDGAHRATFLPSVWGSLPEPQRFVRELMQKAGLPPGHWSPATRALRYTTQDIE
jgi:AmmeMemoRadiSam system protein A